MTIWDLFVFLIGLSSQLCLQTVWVHQKPAQGPGSEDLRSYTLITTMKSGKVQGAWEMRLKKSVVLCSCWASAQNTFFIADQKKVVQLCKKKDQDKLQCCQRDSCRLSEVLFQLQSSSFLYHRVSLQALCPPQAEISEGHMKLSLWNRHRK